MKLQSVLVATCLVVAVAIISSIMPLNGSAQSDNPSLLDRAQKLKDTPPSNFQSYPTSSEPSYPKSSQIGTSSDSAPNYQISPTPRELVNPSPGIASTDVQQPLLLGRYQMQMQLAPNSTTPIVVICDTATGQCWQRNLNSSHWDNLGAPYAAPSGITSR